MFFLLIIIILFIIVLVIIIFHHNKLKNMYYKIINYYKHSHHIKILLLPNIRYNLLFFLHEPPFQITAHYLV